MRPVLTLGGHILYKCLDVLPKVAKVYSVGQSKDGGDRTIKIKFPAFYSFMRDISKNISRKHFYKDSLI